MNDFAQNNNGFVKKVWQSVEYHMQEYPYSTLKDLYKYFFQDAYGSGHLVDDTDAAKKSLLEELLSYSRIIGKIAEPTGYRHNFYRVSLSVIKKDLVPIDLYFTAFVQSAKNFKPVDIDEWKQEWEKIEIAIRSLQLSIPDYQEDRKEIMRRLNEGKYESQHSWIFSDTYRPHYRLMTKEVFHTVILPVITSFTAH